ncbi:MAG: hypothetical protein ACI81R_001661 [Bradymonadia bacterium]|jgi:hypothetical protein
MVKPPWPGALAVDHASGALSSPPNESDRRSGREAGAEGSQRASPRETPEVALICNVVSAMDLVPFDPISFVADYPD